VKKLACLLCQLLCLSACGEDLPSGALLERPRVLGVRVEVEGEPQRAAPRAGETFELRWLLAAPEPVEWSAALVLCGAAPNQTGVPSCAGAPFATLATDAPTATPTFTARVPDPAPEQIVLIGTLTAEAHEPETVLFVFPVAAQDDPPNQHPTLGDERITIDDRPWNVPETPPPSTGCASAPDTDAFPHVAARDEESPSLVELSIAPEDREPYREIVFGEGPTVVDAREEITVSHIASGGRLARLQSIVFDDDASRVRVEWQHPSSDTLPNDGLTVSFIFVARDGRGGMDWVERSLCVTP